MIIEDYVPIVVTLEARYTGGKSNEGVRVVREKATTRVALELLPSERWWGGRVADGTVMPYGLQAFEVNLGTDLNANQGCPLLLSNRGRFVWSERAFTFRFSADGTLSIEGEAEIETGEGYETLRGAFKHVSATYFPPSGTFPDALLFTSPQYNLWIELLYEPTQEKVLAYAQDVLKNGMAPGVLMIDDNWHEPYGTWTFHSGRFPDPRGMIDQLHTMGFKVMLWICPYISPDSLMFRVLEPKGFFLKDHNKETIIRRWWNGFSATLDFTNDEVVEWFYAQTDALQEKYGVDGFKLDAGDVAYYRYDDVAVMPGATPTDQCEAWARVGLRYTLNEYRACWKLGGQPLAQRLKDKNHEWENNGIQSLLPDGLAQGIMGYAYTCPDLIGGGEYLNFLANSDKLDGELFVRHAQCSALFPMMQFSAAPWRVLNEEHLRYCVEAAKLHERMGPEIMELVQEASRTGEPIIRYMEYMYPGYGYEDSKDQFMLGSAILVAPVVVKGARQRIVHFPPGVWRGDDGSVVTGPCAQQIEAPLSRLPWYRQIG
jgi:alpha-glucosidase (family GH31 glycosyl hydrolase)